MCLNKSQLDALSFCGNTESADVIVKMLNQVQHDK